MSMTRGRVRSFIAAHYSFGEVVQDARRLSSLCIRVGVALACVLGLIIGAFYLSILLAEQTFTLGAMSAAQKSNALGEARQTVLLMLGGGIAIGGLIYTHRRHELDRDSNRTDRYSGAVNQLGSESIDIRLGGIYSFERIAEDSKRDRTSIAEVLSAFVREHSPLSASKRLVGSKRIPTDVQAALSVLGRRPYEIDLAQKIDLSQSEIFDATLDGLTLRRMNGDLGVFDSSSFRGSILSFSSFKGATFNGSDLAGASLYACDLRDADLSGANLNETDLSYADLRGSDLRYTDLSSAKLKYAKLDSAKLTGSIVSREGTQYLSEDQRLEVAVRTLE
jgi:hypothetical protein